MYMTILGRQPALGMAELEQLYGGESTRWFSDQVALIDTDSFDFDRLGGSQKAGRVVAELSHGDWRAVSMKIVRAYTDNWTGFDGKITLGISAYGFDVSPRDVQKTGIILKQKLKAKGVSLRLLPNQEPALNTAAAHHNGLGRADNKVELLVARARNGRVVIAQSVGVQNISAFAARDQARPYTDAFVGMLPPKLARMMVNLTATSNLSASGLSSGAVTQLERQRTAPATEETTAQASQHDMTPQETLLDPFCGTGVVLQEAALMGYRVYGTDLADKMIDYSIKNLAWLADSHHLTIESTVHQGDATTTQWQQPIDAIACETYLGQPFSAPPSPAKLTEVRGNCDHIISEFLRNIGAQLKPGTPLCVAVPAWRDTQGRFTHLSLIDQLSKLGYTRHEFKNVRDSDLLYYREDQVVARELLILRKD